MQPLIFALALLTLGPNPHAVAQNDETTPAAGNAEVEALYDKSEDEDKKPEPRAAREENKEEVVEKKVPAKTLSDLVDQEEFSDVAVIQRKFLPKSKRFELSATGITNLNNPFFTNIGVGLGLSYYLTEKWGIEGLVDIIGTTKRQVTEDLAGTPQIDTDTLVTSKYFLGAAIKWNPIYGKMTWLNKRIVPFDMNFSGGLGITRTSEDRNEPTILLGTSQVFAISKGMAVRWNISWHFFNATTTTSTGVEDSVFQNDLFLGLGVSFYFPEVNYR